MGKDDGKQIGVVFVFGGVGVLVDVGLVLQVVEQVVVYVEYVQVFKQGVEKFVGQEVLEDGLVGYDVGYEVQVMQGGGWQVGFEKVQVLVFVVLGFVQQLYVEGKEQQVVVDVCYDDFEKQGNEQGNYLGWVEGIVFGQVYQVYYGVLERGDVVVVFQFDWYILVVVFVDWEDFVVYCVVKV